MLHKRYAVLLLFLFCLVLSACSVLGAPTDEPAPSITGRLFPWGTAARIDNRRVVLCKIIGDYRDGVCELSTWAAVTDDQGKFALYAVPAGVYFILYDSGLRDFDQALSQWGGETLYFSDLEWLKEFLGVDLSTEKVEFRVPEGISHSPHSGWLTHYCTLTLSVGNSPFIVAHDMELAQQSQELNCLVVEVAPGEPTSIEVQVAYFGEE